MAALHGGNAWFCPALKGLAGRCPLRRHVEEWPPLMAGLDMRIVTRSFPALLVALIGLKLAREFQWLAERRETDGSEDIH